MTEQDYKEKRVAIKESGMPLDIQKYFQRLLDKDFTQQKNKESCTGATDEEG